MNQRIDKKSFVNKNTVTLAFKNAVSRYELKKVEQVIKRDREHLLKKLAQVSSRIKAMEQAEYDKIQGKLFVQNVNTEF